MSNSLTCSMCDHEIPMGHRAHRGLIINTMASLSAGLMVSRENLATLRKKRYSKQFQEQREKDLVLLKSLEERIVRDEALLLDLKRINEECYGG